MIIVAVVGMPNAWTNIRNPQFTTNTHGLTHNCYYCTVAALLNQDADDLFRDTEIMQQDNASISEIEELFSAANQPVSHRTFASSATATAALRGLQDGQALALGYTRSDGTGHMVVMRRTSAASTGVLFIDYQQSPPLGHLSLAHESSLVAFTVFYRP